MEVEGPDSVNFEVKASNKPPEKVGEGAGLAPNVSQDINRDVTHYQEQYLDINMWELETFSSIAQIGVEGEV